MPAIRRGEAADFQQIAAIQAACPEAAQWDPAGYAGYELWVAEFDNGIAGFLAARFLGAREWELLNLAVAPASRRKGVARALLQTFLSDSGGAVYLEVRESNIAARSLYNSLNFKEIGVRAGYYEDPPEAAIVMKFHSC